MQSVRWRIMGHWTAWRWGLWQPESWDHFPPPNWKLYGSPIFQGEWIQSFWSPFLILSLTVYVWKRHWYFVSFSRLYFFSVVLSTILSLLTQISIQAIANAIDVPVWVERQTVDLKICMYDRLYQDTIIVNNRWVDNNLTPWLLEKQMNLLFSKPKILYLSIFFIEQPLPWGWSLKYAKSWRTIWNCCQKQATFRLSPTSQHKWSFCQGNNS